MKGTQEHIGTILLGTFLVPSSDRRKGWRPSPGGKISDANLRSSRGAPRAAADHGKERQQIPAAFAQVVPVSGIACPARRAASTLVLANDDRGVGSWKSQLRAGQEAVQTLATCTAAKREAARAEAPQARPHLSSAAIKQRATQTAQRPCRACTKSSSHRRPAY